MKKIIVLLFASFLTLINISCSFNDPNELKVGIDFYPIPQVFDLIKEDLEKEGIKLTTIQMNYSLLNNPLSTKEIDANLIQHYHYMNLFNQNTGSNLVIAQPLYHSIFAIYSNKYKSIDEIEEGTTIYLPEDIVNLPRALNLLVQADLITLKENKIFDATLDDIVENRKSLNFELKSLNTTPLFYDDNDRGLAIMYPTYAKLVLQDSAKDEMLFVERLDEITKTYAISLVTREDNLNDEKIQKLIFYLKSEKIKTFLLEEYGWAAKLVD